MADALHDAGGSLNVEAGGAAHRDAPDVHTFVHALGHDGHHHVAGAQALDEVREDIENPRWYREAKERLAEVDRDVSRKKRGSRSWRKAGAQRSTVRAKVARQRNDHQHKLSANIAARCAIFATEKLTIKNMTASAAGTIEEPGTNVRQKAGLNREILDTAPAALLQKIAYKVQNTGGQFLEAPTQRLKASQTCPQCGAQQKKTLQQRWHCCHVCGHEEDRDSAAARVVLRWALGLQEGQNGPERSAA
jgi:putative transposase